MEYAKLKDAYPVYAPNPLHWHGVQVINPAPEKLTELGWKPVRYTSPGAAPEGCRWQELWTENEDEIIQLWEAVPEPELSPEEALELLLGGEEA